MPRQALPIRSGPERQDSRPRGDRSVSIRRRHPTPRRFPRSRRAVQSLHLGLYAASRSKALIWPYPHIESAMSGW